MTQRTHTPTKALAMTIGEWRLRLAELCRDCAMAESDQEGDCLMLAHALLFQAPDHHGDPMAGDLDGLLGHLPPVARIEALVKQGALDSAALALLPEDASYLMSRSADGVWLASVYLPGMEEELSSQAESLAMALTSALLAAMVQASHGPCLHTIAGADALEREGWATGGEGEAVWQRPAGTLLN